MLSLKYFIWSLMSLIHCSADSGDGNEDTNAADDDKNAKTIMIKYENEDEDGNNN